MASGIAVSAGGAYAKAIVLQNETIQYNLNNISAAEVDSEIVKFTAARDTTIQQLTDIQTKVAKNLGPEKAILFDGYIMLVDDEEFIDEVNDLIKSDLITADNAVHQVINIQASTLEALDDPYLRERSADMRDIGNRIAKNLLNIPIIDLSNIKEEVILIADDLSPADTVQLDLNSIKGFITNLGGKTSHTSIMARSMEIPAIVGSKTATDEIKTGDFVILDAINNKIVINPNDTEVTNFKKVYAKYQQEQQELQQLKGLDAVTLDGHKIELFANIGSSKDLPGVLRNDAQGVGLYRSEFLFMDRSALPTEDEQFAAYKEVLETMGNKLVVLRTMDIGGDKDLPYLNLPKELNPFLGWRAIRICFDRPEIIITQLRAAFRASVYGKLAIMFPMVISVDEVVKLQGFISLVKQQLTEENIPFAQDVLIGVMMETPSAAIMSHKIIQHVDFFSIGTNDLTQYTLAVDRGNEKIVELYNPFNPSVVQLISKIIKSSHDANKFTGMCGEFASNPKAAILLLGLGLDEFSMSASSILKIKSLIRKVKFSDAQQLAEHILTLDSAVDIENALEQFMQQL